MPPPSPLKIATQAVKRLIKEEEYHRKDLVAQEDSIRKLEDQISSQSTDLDQNTEYILKQEKLALNQTKGIFAPLKRRLLEAVQSLEGQIAIATSEEDSATEDQLSEAKEVLELGKKHAESTQSTEEPAGE